MAFSTVTGSNGVTSLVGTTGVDTASIVSLESNVFVGANTGDDVVGVDLRTGSAVASEYEVRLGGGDDTFTTAGETIIASFISGDGLTLANDGADTITLDNVIGSEIVGRGGGDTIDVDSLISSTINGNTGLDFIDVNAASQDSFVYGGQDGDRITTAGAQTNMLLNGNKGADTILLGGAAFTGSVYGGQGIDFINADAVVVADDETGVFLSGDLGRDRIIATDGEDTISGGAGNDSLTAGTGADTVDGGEGDDTILGGAGADIIDGGAGEDTITGGTQGDVITTGAGNDEVVLALGDAILDTEDPSAGFDTITDFAGNTATTAADKNGDTINAGADLAFAGFVTGVGTVGASTVAVDSTEATLAADLTAFITAAGGQLDENAIAITLRGSAWAGNYVVIGDNVAGYQRANDAVIKIDTAVAGLTSEAFELF